MDLVANNLSYKPDDQYHLNEVSFNFKEGNLYTILGRTLSGKTTLLKTIAGLLTPDSGEIEFDGKNFLKVPVWERNVAMVYQQFINYPHLNVFENIAFPLKQRKIDQGVINEKVMDALKSVGLLGYEKRKIQELSGGQQQRVSLARSLVKNAKILLLDEPLVNLDYKLREQLREEFKNLFSKGFSDETILIYSTTDPRETMELNGEVIVLDEGKVLQVGPAKDIFENPNSLKVAEISNDPPMNIIEAKITNISGELYMETNDGISVLVPKHKINSLAEGKRISFGFRAEDIVPLKFGQKPKNSWSIKSKVNLAEPLGTETLIFTNLGNTEVVSRMFTPELVNSNDDLEFALNLDRTYLFDGDTGLAI